MKLTRRQFVMAMAAGIAARTADVRLRITGSAGRRGAELGIDEMSRTAMLLGKTLEIGDGAGAVTIDLDAGRLLEGGADFHVAASDAARRAAVAAWRREHGDGRYAAAEWHPDLERFGAGELNQRFSRRFEAPMGAPEWIGWMLVKVSVEAALRGVSVADARLDGHKGTALTFGPDRRLIQPLCILDAGGGLLGVVETD